MKNYIGIYFIALIILYSCTAKIAKRNTEIDEVTKNEIHLLVDKIIDGFAKNE